MFSRFCCWESVVSCNASEGGRVSVCINIAVQKEAGAINAVSVVDNSYQSERSSHPLYPRSHRPRLLILILEPVSHERHLVKNKY